MSIVHRFTSSGGIHHAHHRTILTSAGLSLLQCSRFCSVVFRNYRHSSDYFRNQICLGISKIVLVCNRILTATRSGLCNLRLDTVSGFRLSPPRSSPGSIICKSPHSFNAIQSFEFKGLPKADREKTVEQRLDAASIEELQNAIKSESRIEMRCYIALIGVPIVWGFILLVYYSQKGFFNLGNWFLTIALIMVWVLSYFLLRHYKKVFALMRAKLEEKRINLQNTGQS